MESDTVSLEALQVCVSDGSDANRRTAICQHSTVTDLAKFRELSTSSLNIFGDEKRLNALCTAGTLFGGRLPLSAIGAFQAPLPLPRRASRRHPSFLGTASTSCASMASPV